MRLAALIALALATALPATAQSPGAGGWRLVSVDGRAAQAGGRIAFASDGAFYGATGCNRFHGQAVAAPGVVTFTQPPVSTRMACVDEDMMAQEQAVFAALAGTVAVAFDPIAERLILIPEDNAPVLGFLRED